MSQRKGGRSQRQAGDLVGDSDARTMSLFLYDFKRKNKKCELMSVVVRLSVLKFVLVDFCDPRALRRLHVTYGACLACAAFGLRVTNTVPSSCFILHPPTPCFVDDAAKNHIAMKSDSTIFDAKRSIVCEF